MSDLRGYTPQHPQLYRLSADGESLDFFFAPCPACHKLSFPAVVPGCAHCGQALENTTPVVRPGGGTLLEFVTLHVPLLPGMETPRITADIRIAEHVIEEGVLAVQDESGLRVGMPLKAIARALNDSTTFTCRFIPAGGMASQGDAA